MTVKNESEVAQSCPTCSDPMDCSLRGSSVHGIFQARVLESVAIAFSGERSWRHFKILSYIWTVKFHKATNKNKLDLDWLTQKYFHNVLSTEKKLVFTNHRSFYMCYEMSHEGESTGKAQKGSYTPGLSQWERGDGKARKWAIYKRITKTACKTFLLYKIACSLSQRTVGKKGQVTQGYQLELLVMVKTFSICALSSKPVARRCMWLLNLWDVVTVT